MESATVVKSQAIPRNKQLTDPVFKVTVVEPRSTAFYL